MELIGSEALLEFVKTVLHTGRVKGESPVSALLIATPECGKTSSIARVIIEGKCKTAMAFTDMTGRGLMKLCQQSPNVSHLIFNDLVTVMAHKESVNRYTLSVLLAMIEEGIQAVAGPQGIETFQNGRRGVIACTTPHLAKDKRQWWHRHGLASRMLPFYYDHSHMLQIRIKDAIQKNSSGRKVRKEKSSDGIIRMHVPTRETQIEIPENVSNLVRGLSEQIASVLKDPKGYRRLKQFLCLVKAHALSEQRRGVKTSDVDWLQSMTKFISYDSPNLL